MEKHIFSRLWPILLVITVMIKGHFGKVQSLSSEFDVVVDLTSTTGVMKRIWDNTGLSPPGPGVDAVKYLTSKEQFLNLAYIGSLPFKAIRHVRIHWLLDLISVYSPGAGVDPIYDYKLLDELIWWLKVHRMRPGFELMGNPGSLFSDLNNNPDKVVLWQKLVSELVAHYTDKFGKDEVKKWRFELWNEPDSKQYNILNLTTTGYLKYALASVKGLAAHNLTLSGPAGTFKDFNHHNISWSLLQMCNTMIAVTGRCFLDTITFHKKGAGIAQQVVSSSAEFYSTSTSLYPLLKNIPFANNEADIMTGWWREEEWRSDVNYAAEVCEVITSFLAETTQQHLSLAYISNDNGFINKIPAYFNQRTLLTRFQMNNSEDVPSQFVRKPVMVAMAMLSYLGPKELPVFLRHLTCSTNCDTKLSVLAAGDGVDISPGWSAAVVMAVSALAANCSDKTLHLRLRLPLYIELTYVVYQLDNVLTNPGRIWKQNGKPRFPDAKLLSKMRDNEGPHYAQTGSVQGEFETLRLQTRCPSVTLVHLCVRPRSLPAKVLQLHAVNVTFNDVLLLWQDSDTRCVKTYEIYYCSLDCQFDDDFKPITNKTIIMLSYQFRATGSGSDQIEATVGKYKVRVRDYWDQLGSFSEVYVYQ